MTGIALIHLFWLSLALVGAVWLAMAGMSRRRRRGGIAIGVMLLVLSLPAILFCQAMWPLDFLGAGRAVRVAASGLGFAVVMVQKPGDDFYESYLEIGRSDGKVTRLMVDYDAGKWWGLRARTRGTRTEFVTWTGAVVASVDFADGTLVGSVDRKSYKLGELDFGRRWANGG
jgi:hypothetical protein